MSGRSASTGVLTDSWLKLWPFLIAAGAIYAAMIWWIGGWWYRRRLIWSGAVNPEPFSARIVYVYQDLVQAAPAIVATIVATLLYASYNEAWAAEESWSSLLLVFVVWSCVTSYKGARAAFSVAKWKGRLWFLILPLVFYVLVVGGIGMLVALQA